ncbi:MAG TPA: hypothetical protein VN829_19805 [Dongiaceae bacterium]|nr:hypothetical protein [Dongiaceae bacterium]
MPIPPLNERGLLPEGIHECSPDELRARFGSFQGRDRRVRLWVALQTFVGEVTAAGVGLVEAGVVLFEKGGLLGQFSQLGEDERYDGEEYYAQCRRNAGRKREEQYLEAEGEKEE